MTHAPDVQNTKQTVEEFGYAVIHVRSVQGDPNSAILFSFTVGLDKHCGVPDLVLTGLSEDTTILMINGVVACQAAGWSWTGQPVQLEGILKANPVELRALHPDNLAHLLGHNNDVRSALGWEPLTSAVQVFWPDRDGLYPWDAGLDPAFDHQARFDLPIPAQSGA